MPKVTFVKEKKEIEVPVGANLRQEAMKAGIELYPGLSKYLNCRGNGLCGTCAVVIKSGLENVSPKSFREKLKLFTMPFATIGHEDDLRLACLTQVLGDCSVETQPAFNWAGENFWQKPYPNK
jgi:ferredoxin